MSSNLAKIPNSYFRKRQILSVVVCEHASHLQVQPYTRGEERPVKHKTTLNKDPASPKF